MSSFENEIVIWQALCFFLRYTSELQLFIFQEHFLSLEEKISTYVKLYGVYS